MPRTPLNIIVTVLSRRTMLAAFGSRKMIFAKSITLPRGYSPFENPAWLLSLVGSCRPKERFTLLTSESADRENSSLFGNKELMNPWAKVDYYVANLFLREHHGVIWTKQLTDIR